MGWEIKPALLYQASRESLVCRTGWRRCCLAIVPMLLALGVLGRGDWLRLKGPSCVRFGSRPGVWSTVGHGAPDDTCHTTELWKDYVFGDSSQDVLR